MASLARRLRRAWRAFRAYEGAQASPQHLSRPPQSQLSPDAAIEGAHGNLTLWGRYLDENHDIAIGIVDDLVTNVVGAGIAIEPRPRLAGRESEELADRILDAFGAWAQAPEVTGELPWGELQRVSCRAWLRDGEFFAQHVLPPTRYPWGESTAYRVEFLESDMVPMDDFESTMRPATAEQQPRHGVFLDAWNRPLAYQVYLRNPYDYVLPGSQSAREMKRVPAEAMLHVKFARRWPQTRGVPICHGIIRRLQDLKDYEDSERIAARVAASMCAFLRKSPDLDYTDVSQNVSGERERSMQSGQIFTDLLPGEEIGTIDVSRPNSELAAFRDAQLRALAAGTGTRYSAIARDYNGTYAAQRQEMVEARPHYLRLRNYYIERFVRPVYERWLRTAWMQGALGVGGEVEFSELARAEFIGPGQPWIDPLKEVQADRLAVESGFKTREQVIRMRGDDPRMIRDSGPRQSAEIVEITGDEDEAESQSDTGA